MTFFRPGTPDKYRANCANASTVREKRHVQFLDPLVGNRLLVHLHHELHARIHRSDFLLHRQTLIQAGVSLEQGIVMRPAFLPIGRRNQQFLIGGESLYQLEVAGQGAQRKLRSFGFALEKRDQLLTGKSLVQGRRVQ